MLEAVARAIARHEKDTNWKAHVPAARAALEALLDPSIEMLEAALPELPDWGDLPEEWRAMLLHVMNERVEEPAPHAGRPLQN